mmetsp:Transcript_28430/g.62543  ORF Transcript_28430/g.62543 Transcript_28430/m.62543 type:complete len:83 (+) Transcript_28430:374-622(+)
MHGSTPYTLCLRRIAAKSMYATTRHPHITRTTQPHSNNDNTPPTTPHTHMLEGASHHTNINHRTEIDTAAVAHYASAGGQHM